MKDINEVKEDYEKYQKNTLKCANKYFSKKVFLLKYKEIYDHMRT